MCVGLPARIVTMKDGMAVVDASGAKREISKELIDFLYYLEEITTEKYCGNMFRNGRNSCPSRCAGIYHIIQV